MCQCNKNNVKLKLRHCILEIYMIFYLYIHSCTRTFPYQKSIEFHKHTVKALKFFWKRKLRRCPLSMDFMVSCLLFSILCFCLHCKLLSHRPRSHFKTKLALSLLQAMIIEHSQTFVDDIHTNSFELIHFYSMAI